MSPYVLRPLLVVRPRFKPMTQSLTRVKEMWRKRAAVLSGPSLYSYSCPVHFGCKTKHYSFIDGITLDSSQVQDGGRTVAFVLRNAGGNTGGYTALFSTTCSK